MSAFSNANAERGRYTVKYIDEDFMKELPHHLVVDTSCLKQGLEVVL